MDGVDTDPAGPELHRGPSAVRNAGVVDQAVDSAEPVLGPSGQRFPVLGRGDVEMTAVNAVGLLAGEGLDVGGDDDRALGTEGGDLGGALSPGGAGDNDHAVPYAAAHLCLGLVDTIGLAR